MSRIDDLNNRMIALQSKKVALGIELEQYHARKREVNSIIRDINGIRDGNIRRVNNHSDKTAENLLAALLGIISIKQIVNQIIADKEKASDLKLRSALSELGEELSRIESKINSLSSELSSVNIKMRNTRSDIREEKWKLLTQDS